MEQAAHVCREIAAMKPDSSGALHLLGVSHYQLGDWDSAIVRIEQALRFNPDDAVSCYQKALTFGPDSAGLYMNLGAALHKKGKFQEAVVQYQKALELGPDAGLCCNMGKALLQTGQLDTAITYFKTALEYDPEFPDVHLNLSLALLLTGNMEQGWREYEWRKKSHDTLKRKLTRPLWDGSLFCESGHFHSH